MDSITVPIGSPGRPPAREVPPFVTRLDWIGPYQPLGLLGRGGQGLVLRVRAEGAGPELALKILHPGEGTTEAERRSLTRELEASRRLKHPAIVPILDAGETEGRPWIVMPLSRQGNLAHRLEKGALEPIEAVTLLYTIACGVAHAHCEGVLHRDLKPSNILLDQEAGPKVSDFGLARFADARSHHTSSGQLLGSYPYMAPEQASGRSHEATPATDVWALGVILYEMLTGQRPFEGTTATVLDQIREARYRSLRERNRSLPPELEAIVARCLQRVPQQRYRDAEALASDLRAWIDGTPLSVSPGGSRWQLISQRARWVSLLLLCLLLGVLLVPLTAPLSGASAADPEQAFRPNERTMLWVPRLGPRYTRFVLGGDEAIYRPRSDPGELGTFGLALLELLPADAKRGPYRLTLQARQMSGGELTDMGLYAGYQSHGEARNRVYRFIQCSFRESGYFKVLKVDSPVRAKVHPHMQIERGKGQWLPISMGGPDVNIPAARNFNRNNPPWRTIVLEVHPNEMRVTFEGQSARLEVSHALQQVEFMRNLQKISDIPPTQFLPSQPAGLIVWNCSTEIRSVVFEKLPARD